MTKAFYDDNENNKLVFSTESQGIQTAVRTLSGTYTQRETHKATVVLPPATYFPKRH